MTPKPELSEVMPRRLWRSASGWEEWLTDAEADGLWEKCGLNLDLIDGGWPAGWTDAR